jgi:ankyrin repeat protein
MNLKSITKIQLKIVAGIFILIFSITGNCQSSNKSPLTKLIIKSTAELPDLDKIINKEYDVNIRGTEGVTPLMLAAILDDAEAIEKLLKLGADINIKDIRGNNALSKSFEWLSFRAAEKLINAGAFESVQISDSSVLGKMLQSAAEIGNLKFVNYLLDKKVEVDYKNIKGKTALHFACNGGHVEVVKALLKAGANVHLADEGGMASFHWAAPNASEEMVQVLLKSGADIYAVTKDGISALYLAAYRPETLRVFLKYMKSPKTIIDEQFLLDDAIDNKNAIELVSILLEFGGNPDNIRRGKLLGTHLHSAISLGEFEMTKLLINAGASMTAKDFNGMTAVDLISKSGREDFKKLLIK